MGFSVLGRFVVLGQSKSEASSATEHGSGVPCVSDVQPPFGRGMMMLVVVVLVVVAVVVVVVMCICIYMCRGRGRNMRTIQRHHRSASCDDAMVG